MRESSCTRRHRSTWVVEGGRLRCLMCREDRGSSNEETPPAPAPVPASAPPVVPSVAVPVETPAAPASAPVVDVSFADGIRGEAVPAPPRRRPGPVKSVEAPKPTKKSGVLPPKRPA